MYDPDHNAPPFHPIPPVVLALAGAIMLIELTFQAGAKGYIGGPTAIGWRQEAFQAFAFSSGYLDYAVTSGRWPLDAIYRFFTYAFLHFNLTHALFAAVLVLALGNVTSKIFAPWAIIVVFLASSAMGAVMFTATVDGNRTLYGAYPAVYGLLGLYTWALWVAAEELGSNPYAAFKLVGVLLGIQILFILIDGSWTGLYAEVSGFATGFVLATLVAPGGLRRLRDKIRQR